jgi:type IV pilus assembly protein PilE
VAYPNYTSYVQRSRRADAAAVLTAVVQAQERYRGNRSTFSSSLDELKVDPSAVTKHYDVNIVNLSGAENLVSGYVVTATPKAGSPQLKDKDCVSLSIQVDGASVKYLAAGQDNRVTSSTCWPR